MGGRWVRISLSNALPPDGLLIEFQILLVVRADSRCDRERHDVVSCLVYPVPAVEDAVFTRQVRQYVPWGDVLPTPPNTLTVLGLAMCLIVYTLIDHYPWNTPPTIIAGARPSVA